LVSHTHTHARARAHAHGATRKPQRARKAEPKSLFTPDSGFVTIVFRRQRGEDGRRRHRGGEDISSLQRASITSRAFLNGLPRLPRSTPRFAAVPQYKSPVPRAAPPSPVQPLREVSLLVVSADWQSTAADEGSVCAYSRTRSRWYLLQMALILNASRKDRGMSEREREREREAEGEIKCERERSEGERREGLRRPHRRHRYARA